MPSWEAPIALGLALAVPAILLLWMLRPRRRRLKVASLLLWTPSPVERTSARPWQRPRNHPLLWLQVLVALLLAVAAARPFLPASAAGEHLVVLLDASGSMRATDVAPSRFHQARERVLEVARGLGPGQRISIIRMDETPRVLVAQAAGAGPVEAALSGEVPSFGPADAVAALALAAGLAEGSGELVLVSDGGLDLPPGTTAPAGMPFRHLAVGGDGGNVALTGLAVRAGPGGLTLQAGLHNAGPLAVAGRVLLLAEEELLSVQQWSLGPGERAYLSWANLPEGPRWYEARFADLDPPANQLSHDDRAWVVVEEAARPSVLLVTAGNTFLERVAGVHGELRVFRLSPDDWEGLPTGAEPYSLTIFDRLWPEELPPGSVLLVGPPTGDTFRPRQVWPAADHPLLRHVHWAEVTVGAARALPLGPDWEVVVDSDGGPLLARREEGGRRVAALAFDLAHSDLALRPAFPVLMANLFDWLLPRAEVESRTATAGSEVVLPASPLAEEMWVEGPAGDRYSLAPPWPPRPFRPPAPALYRVGQTAAGAEAVVAWLVAGGYHPAEAGLAVARIALPAAEGEAADPARGALAWWPWLAVAVLGLATLEWWVDARGR